LSKARAAQGNDVRISSALFFRLVRQEFADRYAGSVLGIVWAVVHPMLLVSVFFAVFAQLMGARLPGVEELHGYGVYLIAGLLPWLAFSGTIRRTTEVLHDRRDVLSKIRLPLIVPPLCVVAGETITFLVGMLVFASALVVTGYPSATGALVLLPLIYLAHQALALGIGLLLGALNVFLKDIQEFVTAVLMVWFWATPIVWVVDIVPEQIAAAQATMNPAYWFVSAYQSIFALGEAPDAGLLLRLAVLAALACALALAVVRLGERHIRDYL